MFSWARPGNRNKPFRVGFTEAELIAAGFVAGDTPPPPGHVSVKTMDAQLWDNWLHGITKSPAEILATLAKGHTEANLPIP